MENSIETLNIITDYIFNIKIVILFWGEPKEAQPDGLIGFT